MTRTQRWYKWRQCFSGAQTRILAWYFLLTAFSTVTSILVTYRIFSNRINVQAERLAAQEVAEFRQLAQQRNPVTGKPFGSDGAAVFDAFLSRYAPPEQDDFALALLDGQIYRSSSKAPLDLASLDPALVQYWMQLTQSEHAQAKTSTGRIFYWAEPLQIAGQTRGVLVVVYCTDDERQGLDQAVVIVIKVALAVLAVAAALAWATAAQVLAPLRTLTATARSINESDLTQRIPVEGADEIAELGITFNEMLDRLEAAFTSQRDFIKDASHELRTPITIIRCHLELLPEDPQERRETIALVTDELDRMSRFVNDLLLLAKAERPNFLKLQTVDLSTLTEELYAKAIVLAPRNWQLEMKGTGHIVVDRQRITQAMMNLAQNAAQYTSDGDTIALGSAVTDDQVRFWVRDTGEGIAPEDQERIFERFARAAKGQRRSEGAGLGLSIVQALIKAHGGRVELFSRVGEGATFTVLIPLVRSAETARPHHTPHYTSDQGTPLLR
ncbi:HAMP domain-containing histidine kinase [Leptolyngbya sp. FACHB-261]|nr:HAMP domain-containing histidine kinase [Leptolyngbya sp. FACHB-261]